MASGTRKLEMQADRIEAVLAQHKVAARVEGGVVTPRLIRFQLRPQVGTKLNKITALTEEIALALGKREARIYREGDAVNVEVPRA
ncbi:MAG TPA: DNA translocase FtsK, partial [Caldilineaceae bacterium]|nr:DNA translocase FtsK [Caldilineaceae bacterium]